MIIYCGIKKFLTLTVKNFNQILLYNAKQKIFYIFKAFLYINIKQEINNPVKKIIP